MLEQKHSSYMAECLAAHPEVYEQLRERSTPSGVTLAECIKTGVDNLGHPSMKTLGIVAGDEHCYETFKDLFDPVIRARHGGYPADGRHQSNRATPPRLIYRIEYASFLVRC